mgnify:CR=1 FL=1
MAYFQPRKRIYTGQIELGPQPRTWIKKHRSFASRDWIESQIRYGEWTKERNKQSSFLIYATNVDGIKPVTILLKLRLLDTHVLVFHVHVLRNK